MILSVNIDHIATLRNARGGQEPDPVVAASIAMLSGADGITLHLREDRRHVNERDLRLLRGIVTTELNLEMAATEEMASIATEIRPDLITIVPERRQELTTEHGVDLSKDTKSLKETLKRLHDSGLIVSIFINPEPEDVRRCHEMGFDMVEIHTGFYANSKGKSRQEELLKIIKAVKVGQELGIATNAGHGLNYHNVGDVAAIESIRGLYIGHSIISRATLVGIKEAVAEMKRLIETARQALK